jgi:hypothetical protein
MDCTSCMMCRRVKPHTSYHEMLFVLILANRSLLLVHEFVYLVFGLLSWFSYGVSGMTFCTNLFLIRHILATSFQQLENDLYWLFQKTIMFLLDAINLWCIGVVECHTIPVNLSWLNLIRWIGLLSWQDHPELRAISLT